MQNDFLPLAEASKDAEVAMNEEDDDDSDSRTLKKKRDVSAALASGLALNGDQHEELARPESGYDTTLMTADSSYSAELMEPTADTLMGQATEKKKRDRSTDISRNARRRKQNRIRDEEIAYRNSTHPGLPG